MELEDHNEETEDRAVEFLAPAKKIFEIIVPILTLMTIVNCVIILVLVMNIGRKVNRLEQQMIILQNNYDPPILICVPILGNYKECRFHPILIEDIKYPVCICARTIIKSQIHPPDACTAVFPAIPLVCWLCVIIGIAINEISGYR